MRRIMPDEPSGGWLFNGTRYDTKEAYEAALAARDAQRLRIAARFAAEGELVGVGCEPLLPHVGQWTPDADGDMRCEEHGLRPGGH